MKEHKKLKIAIIGSGISGLTSAYLLDKHHNITLFEKNDYFGGHTHTHSLSDGEREFNVDSGFIVYNENTYPNFIKLLSMLNVESQVSSMGFSVKSSNRDFEYSGNSLSAIFTQKSNIFNPKFIGMIRSIIRFNKISQLDMHSIDITMTLDEYLKQKNFSKFFINHYIIPMAASIWSTSPNMILEMPAYFFISFFKNHGLLKIVDRPQWWVIKNGSKQYVKKIIANLNGTLLLNTKIKSVKRKDGKAHMNFNDKTEIFDKVIFATHSDQSLSILDDPTKDETKVLSKMKYQKNIAYIHTDENILPKRKNAWSSWNYLLGSENDKKVTLTYNMNILQSLNAKKTFCVTLNNCEQIDKNKIIKEIVYHHPLFTPETIKSQSKKDLIDGHINTYFCGAYWSNGFHEDGVKSAIDVCKKLGVEFE